MNDHTPIPTESATWRVPDRPTLEHLEDRWRERWDVERTYAFDRTRPREAVYAIDTPPPTVSGRLHIGHCFSYTHTDLVARFQRMRGHEVFYPMGWDDNGLNTERRVQLLRGVVCDPSLPYDPDFAPPGPTDAPVRCSRRNFVEICEDVAAELEAEYRDLWTRLGLSVDWSQHYTTIGDRARRVAQMGFLRLLADDRVERVAAPTTWDVDFGTAVAQAEIEERDDQGAMHRLRFTVDGRDLLVDTTRPELLPACVAVVVHPDDERHADLIGRQATTPLFGARVPVHAHELADPDVGTGAVMVCTFGDATDVEWWRQLHLPLRPVVERDGRIAPVDWGTPGWETDTPEAARTAQDELAGLDVTAARGRIVDLLEAAGAMHGPPRPISHTVRFWEHGRRPLEILTTPQWFVRTLDAVDVWRRRGEELDWHPPHMHQRYRDWVDGLNADWNISRQRFFGVPFPVWYPVDDDGTVDDTRPLLAPEDHLPVDPSTDVPAGFTPDQRGRPGGFIAEPDVMDTWATSSLTPQIAGGWPDDRDLFDRVFPYDLRPQAHEIIRTWLFTTVVRGEYHHGALPWRTAAISGFVVDPDRKKLSKSKGNADEAPAALIDAYGADAIRYWAAGARLGADATLDRNRMKVGRRLATKLLHVTRFGLGAIERTGGTTTAPVTEPLDRAWLARLRDVVDTATLAFEDLDHAAALRAIEDAFWTFCDDVVELTKSRAYGDRGPAAATSAHVALATSLHVFQRLLAPFLPFATAETWSWWQRGSVHRAPWPSTPEFDRLEIDGADDGDLRSTIEVLTVVRRTKSEAGARMRAPVHRIEVTAPPPVADALARTRADLLATTNAGRLDVRPGATTAVVTELAPGDHVDDTPDGDGGETSR